MPLQWWYKRLGNLLSGYLLPCDSISFSLFQYLTYFSLLGSRTLLSLVINKSFILWQIPSDARVLSKTNAASMILQIIRCLRASWNVENFSPVILPPIPLVFNYGMLDDLFVWDWIGRHFDMYHSMHNFDGHKDKLDRSCFYQTEDVA